MKAENPFNNLSHLSRTLHVTFPKPREEWRLVSPSPIGEIHGLPNLRGIIIATNGILAIQLTPANAVFFVHLEWFTEDKDIVPAPFRIAPGQHLPAYLDEYV